MNTVATVVSARTASQRLPGKALLPLAGVPMVQFLLERIRGTRFGGRVIFATTERPDDNEVAKQVAAMGIPVFRGADADVAGRYLAVAREYELDWIVRVTGDCPFVDAESLDHCLAQWNPQEKRDLITTKGVFPVGIDYELFSVATLEREWPKMTDSEKEHLTLRFYGSEPGFAVQRFAAPEGWPKVQSTFLVDTPEDYRKAVALAAALGDRGSIRDLLEITGPDTCAA